ncbi:pyridoxamine 5'-phosphate oxidase family protein [Mesorhizobium sp. WSM2239]|uniref:Pyridoxamine 5'-phosphate oxidase family protein n=2 Tax=unclassified Mesorhizobium TaxID=325217 RepID=A0AAU8D1E4_9HYPH
MDSSPFHPDELAAQELAGVGAGGGGIRGFMPDQHRSFFELLPYLFAGVADEEGWPLATMLTGAPGFAHSPDPQTLRIDALPDSRDSAAAGFVAGRDIAILGIDLSTRRRNRANGQIAAMDAGGLTVAVRQSFGNCPQYIQGRAVEAAERRPADAEPLSALDGEARAMISRADTFFVASTSRPEAGAAGGPDISHRGGRPGFVDVSGDTLSIPDFRGNRYFNTLGNFLGEPRAGLLFIDFERGDLLQLQGTAEVDWSGEAGRMIEGAERMWRFHVARGWRRRAAAPLKWAFVDYSPFTERTGAWRKAG